MTTRQASELLAFVLHDVPAGARWKDTTDRADPARLILLDLTMPIMDGWSFVTQYREITASLGADAYLGKPFELTELLRTLEQQLGAIG